MKNINSGSYVLELERWNVTNDGTESTNTSKGINFALEWAFQQGYVEVVLPKGIYLIDEHIPIEPQSFMTLNLGGSILRIKDNSLINYSIISFKRNQQFSRLTNGKLQGDRNNHNYTTVIGTHEHGYGIELGSFNTLSNGGSNLRYITIDNLEIMDCTGDSIIIKSTFGQISPTPTNLANSFEQGSISPIDGTFINDARRIRSKLKIDMNQFLIAKNGYFGVYGNGYGALGSEITTNHYDLIFYKADDSFLSAVTQIEFFDEVDVPLGASYARIVLYQNKVPSSDGCTLNIRVAEFPRNLHIEKCDIHHCRRQGISVCGTKHLYINQCNIHQIGGSERHTGTDPQAGIDVEDGYDLNQYIYIVGNNFKGNYGYDIVVVNGKNINISRNRITRVKKYVSLGMGDGVDRAIVTQNIIYNALVIIAGDTTFSDNNVYGSRMQISSKYHKPINVSNNVFYNSTLDVNSSYSYNVRIDGCSFFNDSDKTNVYYGSNNWTIEFKNDPQIFTNCTFEGKDVYYLTKVYNNRGGWIFENVTFKDVKGIELPGGNFGSCKFLGIDILRLTTNPADDVKFVDCNIMSIDIYNTLLTVNNLKSFSMINCYIEKPNSHILNIQNVTADVSIKNTTIKMKADTLNRAMIVVGEKFNGLMILVEGNVFFASKNQLAVENLTRQGSLFIIRNNILTGASLNNSNKELLGENIINGVIDPYYNMSTEPVIGFYDKGQQVRNLNPDRVGYIGWVCIRAGYANNQAWIASKNYKKGDRIHVKDQVYEAMNNGVSNSSSPFLASEEVVDDNGVIWKYIGQLAVFKTFGEISK